MNATDYINHYPLYPDEGSFAFSILTCDVMQMYRATFSMDPLRFEVCSQHLHRPTSKTIRIVLNSRDRDLRVPTSVITCIEIHTRFMGKNNVYPPNK